MTSRTGTVAAEPVEAQPPSVLYRLGKFARKHGKVLVTASAFTTLLLLGTIISILLAVVATRAKQDFAKQRDDARAAKLTGDHRLYDAHMHLAQIAWDDTRIKRLRELLDEQLPERTRGDDLGGFEWYCWKRLCERTSLLKLDGHTRGCRPWC